MLRFLLDANLSPETAEHLRALGNEAATVAEFGLAAETDIKIIRFAERTGHLIITLDLDFGFWFHLLDPHSVGIIILRLEDQTVESVNNALDTLMVKNVLSSRRNQQALVVVTERKIRIHY